MNRKSKIKSILFFAVLLIYTVSFAQNTYKISGVVRDENGSIPGAAIYISNTKIMTLSDNQGKFILDNIPIGNYEILIHVVGYVPYSKKFNISDKNIYLDASLLPSIISLDEVVIKSDPNRPAYIAMFTELFIGKTSNAEKCKILNPDILNVNYDKENTTLSVSSDQFLIVENKALGYRIKYLLKHFNYNYSTRRVSYSGSPFFEELESPSSKHNNWLKNRDIAYYGSQQHFFKSLYNGNAKLEGFKVFKRIKNIDRKPDSVIDLNLKKAIANIRINNNKSEGSVSFEYWINERKKPKLIFDENELDIEILVKSEGKELKSLNFEKEILVIYTKDTENKRFSESGLYLQRPKGLTGFQTSSILVSNPPILFYKNGAIYHKGNTHERDFVSDGYWAYKRFAEALPLEFEPTAVK